MLFRPQITLKPFQIGSIVIDPPLTLAPMAGQTNHALRSLCRDMGDCGLVCTELISSQILEEKGTRERSFRLFDWDKSESPFAVQLFGNDPDIMADAARTVVEYGADIVDINMGCWVPKIAKRGKGAALLRDVDKATAVVQAVVAAVDVPVTVKIRNGWDAGNPTAIPFAKAAESVGVQAIAIHARFAGQGFNGDADWDYIRQVKEAVNHIPIIGNGDVTCADDVIRMMAQTGCDGVMIGRAALGNPWIFKQIAHSIRTGEELPPPTPQDIAAMAIHQAERTLETTRLPEIKAIFELRGQLLKYVQKLPDNDAIRDGINHALSLEDIRTALAPMYSI